MATMWISKIQSGDTAYNIALNSNVIDSSFSLDANQVLKHANSVTAATAYPSNATTASANGGQIIVRDVQYNAQGHITSSRDRTITLSQTTYTLSGLGGIGSATASGNAPLSLSAAKSGTTLTITGSVAAATTNAAGVIKIDATNTNALLNTLSTGSSTPVDADYFISQYAGGGSTTTTYHRRPVSALWSYIDGKIQNAGYVKSSGVTSITITQGDGITVSNSGTAITGTGTRTITHYTPNGASSTTKGSSAARTYIKQISTDQFGHITGVTTGLETVTNTTYSAGDGLSLTGTTFKISSSSVTNAMLQNSSISIAGSSISLGGSVDASTLRQNLGLSSALRFLGTTTTTMSDNRTTAVVAINNVNTTPTTGDVVLYGDGEYVWTGSAWELLGDAGSFKTVQTAITDSTGTAETTTATRFVYSISQNANGVISVKTRPLPTYNNYSLPLAANETRGGIQIGYSESGTNYAVKLSSEKAYVTVPWTDTKVTQAAATTAVGAYPVILAYSTATTAVTNTVNKTSTLTYNPSTKALSTGGTVNGYTLAAASAKAVDTSIAAASTSTNLPTSQAVASFVEGKGYSTTDTKNTAGSTNTSSKIYLIGATSQTANAVTYSDNKVFATNGVLTATSFSGNGSALTSLNASNLASGTVSEDRLPENAKLFKRDTGEYSIASINSSSTSSQPIASGNASVAMGEYTEASGGASTAFGNRGKAIGKGSFVCGTQVSGETESKAIGDGSAVFGASNIVHSIYGASFGAENIVGNENAYRNGAYSVAYGVGNKITTTGMCGFITGGNNEITKGTCGTVFGIGNVINEGYGTAFGQYNIVNGKSSTIIGKYNEADTTVTDSNANGTYSFMIGNGTGDDARSNAMEVSWAGDVNAQTSLSVAKAVSMVYNATTNALDFVFA